MKLNLTKLVLAGVILPLKLYSAESPTPPAKGKDAPSAKQTPSPPVRPKIVYKPPLRGAPAVRIDGGSRGSGLSLICLTVLAPDQTGLTVQEQPTLFWYQ